MLKIKNLKKVILISYLFTILNQQAQALSFSEVIEFPLKIVTKPAYWFSSGFENKIDEYLVEVTYELNYNHKPLTIKKAVKCEIFAGKSRQPIKKSILKENGVIDTRTKLYPTRTARAAQGQLIHYLPDGKILVFRNPVTCKIDPPYKSEQYLVRSFLFGNKSKNYQITKEKIITIPNKTKTFFELSNNYLPLISIVDDINQVRTISRIISYQYYKNPKSLLKFQSIALKNGSDLTAETDSRFDWIDGKQENSQYPWGKYLREDKGFYGSFGAIILPQEFWSKVPFMLETVREIEKSNPQENFFIFLEASAEEKEEINKKVREQKANSSLINSYQEVEISVNKNPETAVIFNKKFAKEIKDTLFSSNNLNTHLPTNEVSTQVCNDCQASSSTIFKHDIGEYYYPFKYNSDRKLWQLSSEDKGKLILQKIDEPDFVEFKSSAFTRSDYDWYPEFEFNNKTLIDEKDKKTLLLYDKVKKQIIFLYKSNGTYLKYFN